MVSQRLCWTWRAKHGQVKSTPLGCNPAVSTVALMQYGPSNHSRSPIGQTTIEQRSNGDRRWLSLIGFLYMFRTFSNLLADVGLLNLQMIIYFKNCFISNHCFTFHSNKKTYAVINKCSLCFRQLFRNPEIWICVNLPGSSACPSGPRVQIVELASRQAAAPYLPRDLLLGLVHNFGK